MMHAENGIAIDQLVAQALAAGRDRPGPPRPHPAARAGGRGHRPRDHPRKGRRLPALHRAPVGGASAGGGRRGARRGQNVFAETCPQYLYLSLDDLAKPDFEGAKFVCSPPLRTPDHSAALWRGLRTNDLSVVSTDHCPFCFKEQKELGRGDSAKIPNGIPRVEHRMDLLHQGVVGGRDHPAAVGGDLLDDTRPDVRPVSAEGNDRARGRRRHRRLRPGRTADAVGRHAPHERRLLRVRGNGDHREGRWSTISRGRVVVGGGEFTGSAGHGSFLSRDLNQYLA